ncbi:putative ammonium transporter 1 [Physella acuta]|uniref:putative ammonium transporter 1 n=1 Tax=Physella acuta TaxID=109671 RepID=UPI0027DDF3E7|nr:putative ammonium transporter 1 [Physella acuta]
MTSVDSSTATSSSSLISTLVSIASSTLESTASSTFASTTSGTLASTAASTFASTASGTLASTASSTFASTASSTLASTATSTLATMATTMASTFASDGNTTEPILQATERSLRELNYYFDALVLNMDQFYQLVFGIMILLLTMGFAFIEAGSVRSKNTHNILLKNYLDSFVAGISYWAIGWAFAYGYGNGFIGWKEWASSYVPNESMSNYFYQLMFASTACTIVSGALAERCEFIAYLIYSFLLTAFVYPLCSRWGWSQYGYLHIGHDFDIDGKIMHVKYEDFGGSGVVHLVGGTSAFVGAAILGPRIGRFHKETGAVIPIRGHSVPLAGLGAFVLVFGFMAFNAASEGHITHPGDGAAISMAVFNTAISSSMGAFTSMFAHKVGLFGHHWSILSVINGAFVGMVAICGGCNSMKPWGAVIVGFVAAIVMNCIEVLLQKWKIDDPLNAVGVHFGGGAWGALSVAFVKYPTGILMAWDKHSGCMLAWQLAGVCTFFIWTLGTMTIVFGSLRLLGLFRVTPEMEMKGLDIPKHGEPAYPLEAYGHGYFEKILAVVENGQLSQVDQGYDSGIYVKDEGPYEHPEVKVMGIHHVNRVPSMIELDSINKLKSVKNPEQLEKIKRSISSASLSPSSPTTKADPKFNWGPGRILSEHGYVNKGLDLHGEPNSGVRLEHMERTAL